MKPRLLLVFLVAFSLVLACRKTTPPATPTRDADADAPAPILDASTDSPARAGDATAPPALRRVRHGVNLSGAEFGKVIGKHGVDYTWEKTNAAADYFAARGFDHVRLPFRHERLQPKLSGPLDEAEWARLKSCVDHITGLGMTVMLEMQNSYRYGVAGCTSGAPADPNCKIVSEVEIGDVWRRVAERLKGNPLAQINPTNEPHHMPTELVARLGQAALSAIRETGFTGTVAIPGGGWAGAGHFDEDFDGTTRSSKALLEVKDPMGPTTIDLHLYLDANADGAGGDCLHSTVGIERLQAPVAWLRKNGRRAVIGEIAGINTEKCRLAVTTTLRYVEAEATDVIDSWAWWGAGAWSFSTIYPLSIGPTTPGQPEKPQMAWLHPFVDSPARAGDLDGGLRSP